MSRIYAGVRQRAVEIGLTEVAKDVREDSGPNSGTHIDKYFRWTWAPVGSGMEWCGMFVNYCFRRAAEEYGVKLPWGNTTFWKGSSVTDWAYGHTDVLVDQYPIYPGDIYVMNKGHIGMVRATTAEGSSVLYTIDGNQSSFKEGGKSLVTRTRQLGDMRLVLRI